MGLFDGASIGLGTGVKPAKRNNDYVKRMREKTKEGAALLLKGGYEFNDTDRAFVEWLARGPGKGSRGVKGGVPLYVTLFGENPEVGQSITLREVFNKTAYGHPQMLAHMKKWREKYGFEVKYAPCQEDGRRADSTYIIVNLGTLKD
jgi:hypothetical protein